MRKILSITILAIMMLVILGGAVNAVTTDTLADELYKLGAKYGITSADKVKIERYLKDNPVTEQEATQILEKAKEAVKIMEDNNATEIGDVPKADREKLKTIAIEAADIVDLTVSFTPGTAKIYKEGKLIETATMTSTGKLAYTGNNINIALIIGSLAVVALAVVLVARKKIVNA